MKDNIALIVSNKDVKKIRELFNENYPIDIALALEEVDDDVLKNFMFSISNTRLASILEVAEPEFQLRMLEKLPFRRVALLFQQMSFLFFSNLLKLNLIILSLLYQIHILFDYL